MKKLIGIFSIIFLLAFGAQAQENFLSPYSATSDTVTNTGTAYLTVETNPRKSNVVVQVNITRISGTADGTVTLQGSIDGTNYYALTDSTRVPEINTFDVANSASQTFIFPPIPNDYLNLRVTITGVGTTAFSFKALKYERRD